MPRHRVVGDDTVGKAGSAALTQRSTVDFTGAGVTVTEDAGEVLVSVPDAGGAGIITDEWILVGNTSLLIPSGLQLGLRPPLTLLDSGAGGHSWATIITGGTGGAVEIYEGGIYIATQTISTTRSTAMDYDDLPNFQLNFSTLFDSPSYNPDLYFSAQINLERSSDASTFTYRAEGSYTVFVPGQVGEYGAFINTAAQGQAASPDTWDYRLLIQKLVHSDA